MSLLQPPRRPKFIGEARGNGSVPVQFERLRADHATGTFTASSPPPPPVAAPLAPVALAAVELDPRVVAAVSALRSKGEQLAEQARSDALEIGLMVARKILEQELRTSVEPLLSLIRTAVRRAGDSRKVRVHLSPADLERLQARGEAEVAASLSVASVQWLADPELQPGDCIVDTDWGTVDGRLNTRLAEINKSLQQSLIGDVA